jgi:hypothetical protein
MYAEVNKLAAELKIETTYIFRTSAICLLHLLLSRKRKKR